MCSSPHWQVGSSWFREKLSPANRNKRPGTKAIAVSRFREKLSPANWMQGFTTISRKISRSWAPRLQNSRNRWAKKMGSNMRPRYIQFRDMHDRDISGLHCITTRIKGCWRLWKFGNYILDLIKLMSRLGICNILNTITGWQYMIYQGPEVKSFGNSWNCGIFGKILKMWRTS